MFVSYCTTPIVLGHPNAAPLLPAGVATAFVSSPFAPAQPSVVNGVPVHLFAEANDVTGLPYTLPAGAVGAIVPLDVAAALRVGGYYRSFRIYTPAPAVKKDGVWYTPYLQEHDDLYSPDGEEDEGEEVRY